MSVFAEIYTYGAIVSPAAYYLFGRPLITRSEFVQAYQNRNTVIGILQQARADLDILLSWIVISAPSDGAHRIYGDAKKLWRELDECIRISCMEGSAMSNFWFEYDGVISRWSLSEEQIELGRAHFTYWLDFEERNRDAAVKVDAVREIWRLGRVCLGGGTGN